jgi:two-component system chemotaxis sensor kinase CheA
MAVDISQFHEMFFEESFEGLEVMENGLLNLPPGSSDIELINDIFRAAHSIKGGAATFGFGEVSEFTHDLETLMDLMREGKFSVTSEAVELMLQAVDCLRNMLTELKDKRPIDYSNAKEISKHFKLILESPEPSATESEQLSAANDTGTECKNWRIVFKPNPEMLQTGNEPYRIIRELGELGNIKVDVLLDDLPTYELIDPCECYLAWQLDLSGDAASSDAIDEIFEWVIDDAEIKIEEVPVGGGAKPSETPVQHSDESAEVNPTPLNNQVGSVEIEALSGIASDPVTPSSLELASPKAEVARGGDSKSIRVNIEKVDALINMVGEMVITQSMLCQLSKEYNEEKHNDLVTGLAQLEANTRELQESVMSLRMMPISFAFNRFPRLVRDLNRQLKKDVDLVLHGEQTELDKTVMEKLGDPLTHLVRNAMDHGMETPQERMEKGKPEKGRIELKAFYEGGAVVIQICDDGKGLDDKKIQAKAVSNGLIQEGEVLSREEIQDLILRPGFSTADQVSDLSGRGVGLDVVKQNIRALNGSLDVQSNENVGTTFTIRLPLTLAIVDGQLIRVEDSVYILPLTSISESLQLDEKFINTVAGGVDLYRIRDENIPVVHLNALFGHKKGEGSEDAKMMVVVESNERKLGLVVDELLDQQQVVIKSLEANYQGVEGLSGATILGDGTVALICDIHDIFSMSAGQYQLSFDKIFQSKHNHAA